MVKFFLLIKKAIVEPMGSIAASSIMICAVSGIILAVPYSVNDPFNSISRILLDNPAAAYFRNIHFWSAQSFLVFSILHMVDHFIQKTEYNLSRGVWLRLTLSLPVILFAMISGFILRGDADGLSAYRIITGLFHRLPLAGEYLRQTFLGREENLELIYVHHIATATIIIFIIYFEHARRIWPNRTGFIITLFVFLLISYFIQAPFNAETGAGPWYFIGFQELLHWFSRPGLTWLIFFLALGLIWALPLLGIKRNVLVKNFLLILLFIYILCTITGTFFRGNNWAWELPWKAGPAKHQALSIYPLNLKVSEDFNFKDDIPLINGRLEGCIVCHDNVSGIEPAHDPQALGCLSCHGGNPFSLDKKQAHKNIVLIPGNLADAGRSCGTASCHPDIASRIPKSIMATMSGVVTVDRFVFGESSDLNALAHVGEIGHSAADQHLRDLCANCHLGNPKTTAGPVTTLSRGGGCNACHLNYSDSALASLNGAKEMLTEGVFYHPQLNLEIADSHCFGCHSRSGRIATSYEGWHETLLERKDIPDTGRYRELEDMRVLTFVNDDVHHRIGMSCVDCHISYELMGDGTLYAHKEGQVKITCGDCHFSNRPKTKRFQELDAESKKILARRKWETEGLDFILTSRSGLPLINTWLDSTGNACLRLKSGDTSFILKAPANSCTGNKSHESLSCESCHTEWVPQCIGCHNAFDKDAQGYDMLANREKMGTWIESVGRFMADQPVLGVVQDESGVKTVKTFTPGMILTIDKSSFENDKAKLNQFHRLYAPIAAHTTVREARDCKSCHLDPLAIGYGRGELLYEFSSGKGRWIFRNKFALNEMDHLPEDAWIGFLSERTEISATRENARPFSLGEQKRILTAGACLVCHEENSRVIQESLSDFPALLKKVSPKCVLPAWE